MTNFSGENLNIGARADGPQGERRDSASSRYQAYPEYKDSGVEWFGDIPSDWAVWKWKHTLVSPMTYGANEAALDDDVKNPRYIRITDMNSDGSLRDDTFKSLPFDAAKNYLLKDGDILVARTGATVGKSFLYKEKLGAACFAGYLIRARINKKIVEPEFVSWYLQSDQYWKYISSSQIQATLQNVSAEKYGDMEIAIPSKKLDRLSIANFLDHETAKIDTLIEQQQKLIQLLKEKRQAVISHAVTKGLNPDAPMKDSGVEWLGEVPEHWEVCRLKHVAKIESGHTPDKKVDAYWVDCDIPWVSLNDSSQLKEVDYISETSIYLNEKGIANSSARKLPPRSVVFTRDASIGLSAITTKVMAVSQHVIAWICLEQKVIPEFLLLIFYAMSEEFNRYTFGATLKTIGMADVNKLTGAFPSLDEQKEIIRHVFQMRDKLDILISKAEINIKLIQERRTALISAAVTGKIDVRGWQAPTAN